MYPDNNPSPHANRPVRRVGTTTMALSLIATGAVMLAKLFFPAINLLVLLRFSPAILVILGVEILLANVFIKNGPLKYDFLSVFLSFILITGSLTAAVGAEFLRNGLNAASAAQSYVQELSDKANDAVKDLDYIAMVDVAADDAYYLYFFQQNQTADDFAASNHVQLRVYYSKEFESKEAFAAACEDTIARLTKVAPTVSTIWFSYLPLSSPSAPNADLYLGDTLYSLGLHSYSELRLSAADMLPLITEWEWDESTSQYYILGSVPPSSSAIESEFDPESEPASGPASGSQGSQPPASSSQSAA